MQESTEIQEFDELEELRGVDLAMIDLAALDLDRPPTSSGWLRIMGRLFVIFAFGVLVWIPQSEYFRLHNTNNAFFFSVCIGAISLGAVLGRWLWQWLEQRAKQAPVVNRDKTKLDKIPSMLVRILMALTIIGLGTWVLFVLPNQGPLKSGSGYSQNWFGALGAAALVAILLSRWIVYQAQRPSKPRAPRKPIKLPSWFKWVNLVIIVGAGIFTAFGAQLFSTSDSMDVEFGLGAMGLIVGMSAAIWLAGRFDETEARLKAQARKKHQ